MPLISIIVPTKGRPETLFEALASASEQTLKDREIIVVSNGETEEERENSSAAAAFFGARYYALASGNVSAARNFGVDVSAGEWIAFLDDDDLWRRDKLAIQLKAAQGSGADVISCDCIEFYPDGSEKVRRHLLPQGWTHLRALCHQKWIALPSCLMIRREALLAIGGFDPSFRFCEDGDLLRRLAWGHSIHEVPLTLARYRRHPGAASEDRRSMERHDIKLYVKMIRDTPISLRSNLPSPISFASRWLLRKFMPRPLRHPRKALLKLRPAK